jgi:hypothetical protein
LSIRLREEETELVINHLETIEQEIDAVRKILLGKFEIKKKEALPSNGGKVSDNGAIQLDLDVSGITFKQKAGVVAGPHAKWGWAFAYRQEGGYHKESQELVQALEQYGNVQVGKRIFSLGGRDGNLINFKEA